MRAFFQFLKETPKTTRDAADIIVAFKPRFSEFQGLETKTFPNFAKIDIHTPAPSTKPVLYQSK